MSSLTDAATLKWRKSSKSSEGNCVEVAESAGAVYVRDTKNRDGGTLRLARPVWGAFVGACKADTFRP